MCAKLGMAAGIDGARIMKVTRLRTERGEWNGVGKLEQASGGSQQENSKKRSKVCFWKKADDIGKGRERGRRKVGSDWQ